MVLVVFWFMSHLNFFLFKILARGFRGGTLVKNLPTSEGDAGGGV